MLRSITLRLIHQHHFVIHNVYPGQAALLSRGGLFADMVDEHGETAARHIRALADGGSLVDLMKTGEFASLEASARALELSSAAGRSSMISLPPLARPEAPPAYDSSSISWSAEPMTAGPSQADHTDLDSSSSWVTVASTASDESL